MTYLKLVQYHTSKLNILGMQLLKTITITNKSQSCPNSAEFTDQTPQHVSLRCSLYLPEVANISKRDLI